MSDLEPTGSEQALEMYVKGRRDELSDRPLPSHVHRLEAFTQWCDEVGIGSLNTLTGRDPYAPASDDTRGTAKEATK